MTQRFDAILKSGTVVNQDGEGVRDVAIAGGRIAEIGGLANASAAEVIDCRGLHVLPGVIDTQVHFREPGLEHKEDLATGTKAAALGGVVAVFEMPNTKPGTTPAALLEDKLARAQGRAWVDHAFFVGASPENFSALPALERLPGCAGVKLFMGSSTGSLLVPDDGGVLSVLKSGRRRVAVHAEDEARLKARRPIAIEGAKPHLHPVWRDEETALRAVHRLVA